MGNYDNYSFIKIFTSGLDEDGNPLMIEDNVYHKCSFTYKRNTIKEKSNQNEFNVYETEAEIRCDIELKEGSFIKVDGEIYKVEKIEGFKKLNKRLKRYVGYLIKYKAGMI